MLFSILAIPFFFAIETRFGLLATMILSIKSLQLLVFERPQKNEAISLYFGAIFFAVLSSLLSYYILLLSGAING